MRFALTIAAAACWLAVPASPQQPEDLWARVGDLQLKSETEAWPVFALGEAGTKVAEANLRRLAQAWSEPAVLNPPKGFQARLSTFPQEESTVCEPRGCANVPFVGATQLVFSWYARGANGVVRAGLDGTMATAWVNLPIQSVRFDYPGYSDTELKDEQGRDIFLAPRKTREIDGYPVYEERTLVISDQKRPLWLPVTREGIIRARIREAEVLKKQAQDERKATATTVRGVAADTLSVARAAEEGLDNRLSLLRKELESTSAGERAAPAWVSLATEANPSGLTAEGTAGAHSLVVLNSDYFDASRPRYDAQLLVVNFYWSGWNKEGRRWEDINKEDGIGAVRLREFIDQVAWERVAGLIIR